jgi:hypothetical protein
VINFSREVVQVKKANLKEDLVLQMLFQGKRGVNVRKKDLVKGFDIKRSSF